MKDAAEAGWSLGGAGGAAAPGMRHSLHSNLGIQLMRASFDENLDRAAYLTDACVYGLFSLHGVSMLFSALADYDREYGHVMPYGDVPLLFMLSAVLFVTKRGYDAAKQA